MARRQMIMICVAGVLAAVLVIQYLWPRSNTPAPIVPTASASRDESGSQTQAPSPTGSPGSPGTGTAGLELSYPELFAVSQRPRVKDLPALKQATKSKSWESRQIAVTGIGRLMDKGDPQMLRTILTNPAEKAEVRAAAAEALGAMRYIDAGPDLINAMSDSSELVRAAAGVAISRIMGMRFEFSARAPLAKREEAIALARKFWPEFYPRLKQMQNRGH